MFPQLNCHSLGLCIYGEIRDTLLKVLQIIGNIIYTSLSFRRDIENLLSNFFSIRLFFSQTLTIYRTAGEGRAPSFIPLYHFHPLKNIQTLICTFACEMIYFSWVVFHVTDTSPWLLKSTSSEVYPNYFLLRSFLRNTASETTVGTLLLIVQHLRYLQDFIQHH